MKISAMTDISGSPQAHGCKLAGAKAVFIARHLVCSRAARAPPAGCASRHRQQRLRIARLLHSALEGEGFCSERRRNHSGYPPRTSALSAAGDDCAGALQRMRPLGVPKPATVVTSCPRRPNGLSHDVHRASPMMKLQREFAGAAAECGPVSERPAQEVEQVGRDASTGTLDA